MFWAKTCTVGVDAGCATANKDDFSILNIDGVSGSTLTFHVVDPDSSSGTHTPVVGGAVYFGALYAHGEPTMSRSTYRLLIIDPQQYANVIAGSITMSQVQASEETDLTTDVSGFGSPTIPNGGLFQWGSHPPIAVMVDPTHQQIILGFQNGTSNTFWVFNVSHTP